MTTPDFQDYLRSLPHPSNQDWGDRYTPTQVELPLKVQAIAENKDAPTAQRQPQKQVRERFEVLTGLRKAVQEHHHVLLVGKPGSGKSTALRRLLWEEAQKCLEFTPSPHHPITPSPLPVLIELRDCRSGDVLGWIQKSLRRLRLSREDIEDLLFQNRVLLLFDGLNELPSTDAWTALDEFRRDEDFQATRSIITTRELGVGADLGIEKKLEMVPLTEPQMRDFIQKRLPEQADNLLRQLRGRLRELAETPLLLQMLCEVVAQSKDGQIPQNRGELFRQEFARRYEAFKPLRGRVSEDSRRFAPELLQHLAFIMIQGAPHTDPLKPTPSWLTIPKTQAETILETYLTGRVAAPAQAAKEWLEDLVEHHLLQLASDPDEIEFHHQLFQEYYGAEALLQKLLDFLKDETSSAKFQQDYLNYLKWTEVISLMAGLLDDEIQGLKLVDLALRIDLMLGARLSGKVKNQIQKQSINLITRSAIPQLLRIEILGATSSSHAIPEVQKSLEQPELDLRKKAVDALERIGSDGAIEELLKLLEDPNNDIADKAAKALSKIGNSGWIAGYIRVKKSEEKNPLLFAENEIFQSEIKQGIKYSKSANKNAIHELKYITNLAKVPNLTEKLNDEEADAYPRILEILSKETVIVELLELLDHQNNFVREITSYWLGKSGNISVVPGLLKALNDRDIGVRWNAAYWLGEFGSEAAIPELVKALEDEEPSIRWRAAYSLEKIGSQSAMPGLFRVLKNSNSDVRWKAAYTLGKLGSKIAIPELLEASKSSVPNIRATANEVIKELTEDESVIEMLDILQSKNLDIWLEFAEALEKLDSSFLILEGIRALEDQNPLLRWSAVEVLGKSSSSNKRVIQCLCKATKDESAPVRWSAIKVLGTINDKDAVTVLLEALENKDSSTRWRAAEALGEIGYQDTELKLVKVLDDQDSFVRCKAAEALGKISSEHAVPSLIKGLRDDDYFVCWSAVEALEKIGGEVAIQELANTLNHRDMHIRERIAEAIGRMGEPSLIPTLWNLQQTCPTSCLSFSITSIQKRCRFYNYEIAQSAVEEGDGMSSTVGKGAQIINNIYNFDSVGNVNTGKVNIHGNQVGEQHLISMQSGEEFNPKNFEEEDKPSNPVVKTILVLASSPVDMARLRLDKEVREIEQALKRSQKRDQFKLEPKWAVRANDLRRALLDVQPQIVHFCGHGIGAGGLLLEDQAGQSKPVSTEALADLFALFANQIECVVLNACYSDIQAHAIVQQIPYVIGMQDAVGDTAAIQFAIGFYDGLGGRGTDGNGYEAAYQFGRNAIHLENLPDYLTPKLLKKSDLTSY